MRTASKLVSEKSLFDQLNHYHKAHNVSFYEWIPDNKQVSFLRMKEDTKIRNQRSEASLAINDVAIGSMFRKTAEEFTNLFRRNAYLHWYT